MSTTRSEGWKKVRRNAEGFAYCKNECGKVCPTRRRLYCSEACAEDYAVKNFPNVARDHVFKRDRGVCASCGLDTEHWASTMRAKLQAIENRVGYSQVYRWRIAANGGEFEGIDPEWLALMREKVDYYGQAHTTKLIWVLTGGKKLPDNPLDANERLSPWDMDHILPVAEGGGQCGLDNLQTLCCKCHRKKTAEQRANAARLRRLTRAAASPQSLLSYVVSHIILTRLLVFGS